MGQSHGTRPLRPEVDTDPLGSEGFTSPQGRILASEDGSRQILPCARGASSPLMVVLTIPPVIE